MLLSKQNVLLDLISFPNDRSNTVPLLQFFFLCASVVSYMWRLFRPYLFLISASFVASGGLYFVIVAFPGKSSLICFQI